METYEHVSSPVNLRSLCMGKDKEIARLEAALAEAQREIAEGDISIAAYMQERDEARARLKGVEDMQLVHIEAIEEARADLAALQASMQGRIAEERERAWVQMKDYFSSSANDLLSDGALSAIRRIYDERVAAIRRDAGGTK